MEYQDVYNANREPTGRVALRGVPRKPDEYVLVAHILVRNGEGRFFTTKRPPTIDYLPDLWEYPGGGVRSGETTLDAALREFQEETGFTLRREDARLALTQRFENPDYGGAFMDDWLFERDLDIADFIPCEGETVAARWSTADEIYAMHERGEFVPFSVTGLDKVLKSLGGENE
ncbi:MAG: NUDIX domain-containing protein [Oscillospiraceae bacterium]|nr:NUDIX domain-containing protein [Oscillospiraceae bacterium]